MATNNFARSVDAFRTAFMQTTGYLSQMQTGKLQQEHSRMAIGQMKREAEDYMSPADRAKFDREQNLETLRAQTLLGYELAPQAPGYRTLEEEEEAKWKDYEKRLQLELQYGIGTAGRAGGRGGVGAGGPGGPIGHSEMKFLLDTLGVIVDSVPGWRREDLGGMAALPQPVLQEAFWLLKGYLSETADGTRIDMPGDPAAAFTTIYRGLVLNDEQVQGFMARLTDEQRGVVEQQIEGLIQHRRPVPEIVAIVKQMAMQLVPDMGPSLSDALPHMYPWMGPVGGKLGDFREWLRRGTMKAFPTEAHRREKKERELKQE